MSLDQFAPVQVTLSAAAPELPNFGISALPLELTSIQVSNFLGLSGGLSTLRVTPASFVDTLGSIGVTSAELAWIDVTDHFGGDRKPEEAYLTFRGAPDQVHAQTVTLNTDAGSATQARVGEYRIDDLEGGPYVYNSLGAAQATELEIADAGGGDGATGRYIVSDNAGNSYTYESGGTNLWTFVVLSAAVGLYTAVAEGVTYSYTATGADTIQSIRDGILADMNNLIAHPGGHPEWISNVVGSDTITLTGSSIGLQLTVTSNLGPGGTEASMTETTPLVAETVGAIAAAIDAVITGVNPPPPVEWTTSVALGVITATAQAAFVGIDLGVRIAGPAPADATTTITVDHRETIVTVLTALDAAITAVSHPTFTHALLSPVITITGVDAGVAIPASVSSPSGSLVLQETQSTLTLRSSQVSRVTIVAETGTDAYVGAYTLSLLGQNLMHTALAGASITSVRDALQASVDLNLGAETATLAQGTDALDITMTEQGKPVVVTLTSPGSNAGGTVVLQTASYGAVDDFDRALDDEGDWYFWVQRGTDTDIEVITIHVDDIEAATPRRHFAQASDQGIPDDPSATATDIAQFVKDTGTRRTSILWDPVPSSSVQDQQGVVHQWVGVASTYLPGAVQWHALILDGLSGGQKLTGAQEGVMRDKAAAFLEFVGSLGTDGQRITNGPYVADGRQQDTARALDQIRNNYQVSAVALLAASAIIPYTDQGIQVINAMLQQVTAELITQGLVIENSFRYLPTGAVPTIEDATQAQREQGIFPTFTFQIKIQLGGVQIPMQIEVSQ